RGCLPLVAGERIKATLGESGHGSFGLDGSLFQLSRHSGGCRRGFPAKYCSCASRSTSVSSGSRLLSGKTRTTGEFASTSLPGTGSSGVVFSRQCALTFSQKICAVTLPALAEANK